MDPTLTIGLNEMEKLPNLRWIDSNYKGKQLECAFCGVVLDAPWQQAISDDDYTEKHYSKVLVILRDGEGKSERITSGS